MQSLVLEELRALLREDVCDPDVSDVHFVAVALSVDCRHARVHFVLGGTSGVEPRPTLRALERATPLFRAGLAEAIEMKRVPDLRFLFDGIESAGDDEGAP